MVIALPDGCPHSSLTDIAWDVCCICIYVYVYVYVYVYMYMCMWPSQQPHQHRVGRMCMHVCMCICMHVYAYTVGHVYVALTAA